MRGREQIQGSENFCRPAAEGIQTRPWVRQDVIFRIEKNSLFQTVEVRGAIRALPQVPPDFPAGSGVQPVVEFSLKMSRYIAAQCGLLVDSLDDRSRYLRRSSGIHAAAHRNRVEVRYILQY